VTGINQHSPGVNNAANATNEQNDRHQPAAVAQPLIPVLLNDTIDVSQNNQQKNQNEYIAPVDLSLVRKKYAGWKRPLIPVLINWHQHLSISPTSSQTNI